jgi:hypothetical protein
MPSTEHDAIAELFVQRPELAPDLLRMLGLTLPAFSAITSEPAAFSQTMATEYRADLVLALRQRRRRRLLVVIEVQREIDPRKLRSWPVYQAAARARHGCPVVVLVVCLDRAVADWARQQVPLGGGSVFRATVLGPDELAPTTTAQAHRQPERAVLAALMHGRDESRVAAQAARAAIVAARRLDDEQARFYTDLVFARLDDVAKTVLETLMLSLKNYEYQSEFARKYYGQGLARGEKKGLAEGEKRGRLEGKAAAVVAVLRARGLRVTRAQAAQLAASTDQDQLDRWLVQVVTVASVSELLAGGPQGAASRPTAVRPAAAPRRRRPA